MHRRAPERSRRDSGPEVKRPRPAEAERRCCNEQFQQLTQWVRQLTHDSRQTEIRARLGNLQRGEFYSSVDKSMYNRILEKLDAEVAAEFYEKETIHQIDYLFQNPALAYEELIVSPDKKPLRAMNQCCQNRPKVRLRKFSCDLRVSQHRPTGLGLPKEAPRMGWASEKLRKGVKYTQRNSSIAIYLTEVTSKRPGKRDANSSEVEIVLKNVQEHNIAKEILKIFLHLFGDLEDNLSLFLSPAVSRNETEFFRKRCWEAAVVPSQRNRSHAFHLFPGSMPVSLSRRHFDSIGENYFVSEKTDGIRYMMMVSKGRIFMINRKFEFCHLLDAKELRDKLGQKGDVILDGEIVQTLMDPFPLTFMIFDILKYEGEIVSQHPLPQRLDCVRKVVSSYRDLEQSLGGNVLPFQLIGKNLRPMKQFRSIADKIVKKGDKRLYDDQTNRRCHLTDGFIFTPPGAYNPCSTENLFKWKYVDMLSVDFQILPKKGRLMMACTGDGNTKVYCQELDQSGDCYKRVLEIANKNKKPEEANGGVDDFRWLEDKPMIVEMTFNASTGLWVFHLERRDKNTPNYISVVFDTLKSIAENITTTDLSTLCGK